jgi:anti-sigma B factor antagonist
MMTTRTDSPAIAVQQTARRGPIGRAVAEATALPPLKADAEASANGSSAAAQQSGSAGSPRGAAPAENGSAGGNTGHPNATKRGDRTTMTPRTPAGRPGAWRVKLDRVSGHSPTASLLGFAEQRVGRRAVLTVVGEVDISTVADLHRALETAGDADATEIWLDLTHTTFMDCSGLHALLDRRARLREVNRRLVLICPAGPVLRLLVLAGVDHEFEIYPTRTAAQYAN